MNAYVKRRKSSPVRVGSLTIGGDAPLSVQSMLNTDPHDLPACLAATKRLAEAGCDIVRLTVPDLAAAEAFSYLREAGVTVPLVADIHFDYKLALAAVEAGAHKIRLNPGNIGDASRVRAVANACRRAGVPIRIGVNGGSLEKDILAKHGGPTPEALVESAFRHTALLEAEDFTDIVISVKTSSVSAMIAANRLLAERCEYPLHLGVTEAGSAALGSIRSAVGIGTLLSEGIGDTLRVSLTEDPVLEVKAAYDILDALSLSEKPRLRIVSCPTCGRTSLRLVELTKELEAAIEREGLSEKPLTVAVMGCIVNGPGEAREADLGIAGGHGEALLFSHGAPVAKVRESDIIRVLIEHIRSFDA